jgi:hypothetical protein
MEITIRDPFAKGRTLPMRRPDRKKTSKAMHTTVVIDAPRALSTKDMQIVVGGDGCIPCPRPL